MPTTPEFVVKWFLNSLAKKGAVAIIAGLAWIFTAPVTAPVLAMLGIKMHKVGEVLTVAEGFTVISMEHAVFGVGLAALSFMGFEAIRILLAKHPKSPAPESVKKVL